MADHGFGKVVASSSISDADLEEIAKQISKKDYIARAYVVTHACGTSSANIHFKFKHISNYQDAEGNTMTHEKMVAEIEAIVVNGHSPRDTDVYLKQKAFERGRRRPDLDPE